MLKARQGLEFNHRKDANGPAAYAYRLAGYIGDADYIHALTRREYGNRGLPDIVTIRAMQADHKRKRDRFRTLWGAPPINDNIEEKPAAQPIPARAEPFPRLCPDFFAPREQMGARILRMTAEAYGYTLAELKGRGRTRRLVCARMVAARLLRNLEDGSKRFSLTNIGYMLDHDHSSVCYWLEVFGSYRRTYPEMKAIYNLLRRRLAK